MVAIDNDKLTVEVAYARPDHVHVLTVAVAAGASIRQVIIQSGLLDQCPEIDLNRNKVGIFGEICTADTPVRDHCRVEIYRPLLADPKTARRKRAGTLPA